MKILYFASLRETLGVSSEELVLPTDVTTVNDLRAHLAARGDAWNTLMTAKNLRAAVNQVMAGLETPITAGDEVAFFPPVTGG